MTKKMDNIFQVARIVAGSDLKALYQCTAAEQEYYSFTSLVQALLRQLENEQDPVIRALIDQIKEHS